MSSSAISHQLVSVGGYDTVLTLSPQRSHFSHVYRQHTPFALETVDLASPPISLGKSITVQVKASADMLSKTYVRITLPTMQLINLTTQLPTLTHMKAGLTGGVNELTNKIRSVSSLNLSPYFGYAILKRFEVFIGNDKIDEHYGEWMMIWSQMTTRPEDREKLKLLVGQRNSTDSAYDVFSSGDGIRVVKSVARTVGADGTIAGGSYLYELDGDESFSRNHDRVNSSDLGSIPSITLHVPLSFWFCRSYAKAVPLIALQHSDIRFNIELATAGELGIISHHYEYDAPYSAAQGSNVNISSIARLVFSDGSVQDTPITTYSAVPGIVPGRTVPTRTPLTDIPGINIALESELIYLGYSEKQALAHNSHEYLIERVQSQLTTTTVSAEPMHNLVFSGAVKSIYWVYQPGVNATVDLLPTQRFNYTFYKRGTQVVEDTHTAILENLVRLRSGLAISQSIDPNLTASIRLNNQIRVQSRGVAFFQTVQRWSHYTGDLGDIRGINSYSFALNADDTIEPSGSINLTNIRLPELSTTLDPTIFGLAGPTGVYHFRAYALSYNVLRISKGLGGLAFAR